MVTRGHVSSMLAHRSSFVCAWSATSGSNVQQRRQLLRREPCATGIHVRLLALKRLEQWLRKHFGIPVPLVATVMQSLPLHGFAERVM